MERIEHVLLVPFALLLGGCFLVDGLADTDGDTELDPLEDNLLNFHHRFYIAQLREYNGKEGQDNAYDPDAPDAYPVPDACRNDDDVYADAFRLASTLLEDGTWSGMLRGDPYATPLGLLPHEPGHFAETTNELSSSVPMEADISHADVYDVAVYSGHGGPGILGLNELADGQACNLKMQNNIRLGRYCGGVTKLAIYSASCVLGIREDLCPLPISPDGQPLGDWPDVCFQPLRCTSGRSLSNHTLGFVDSPTMGEDAPLRDNILGRLSSEHRVNVVLFDDGTNPRRGSMTTRS